MIDKERRKFLMAGIVGAAASLAGCSSIGNPGNAPGNEPNGTATGTPGRASIGEPCDRITVGGRIATDTTFGENCDQYLVTETLQVTAGATLTVEPSVTLVFRERTGLVITDGGRLLSEGTEENPITFTGAGSERGAWEGIFVRHPDGVGSRLHHTVVEYAGGDRSDPGASLTVESRVDEEAKPDALVSLRDATIRESAGYGLVVDGASVGLDVERSTVTRNAHGPARLPVTAVHELSAANSYRGNDTDYVHVRAGQLRAPVHRTWRSLDVPYYLDGSLDVYGGSLELAPGTLLTVAEDSHLITRDDGALATRGTAADPVRLTARQKGPGGWRGVVFNTADEANGLEHTIVEYAGGEISRRRSASVKLGEEGAPERVARITDCLLVNGGGYGIEFLGNTTADLARNRIVGHEAPVYVPGGSAHQMDPDSEHADNADGAIHVTGDQFRHVRGDQLPADVDFSWAALDVPYVVDGVIVVDDGLFAPEPGSQLLFRENGGIDVKKGGQIRAEGTDGNPVLFGAVSGEPGGWRGIRIWDSTGNRLVRAVITNAGDYWRRTPPATGDPASVIVNHNSDTVGEELRMTATAIRDGASYGFAMARDVTATIEGCQITGHAFGPARVDARTVHQLDETTVFDGGPVRVDGAQVRTPATVEWKTLSVPYLVYGTVSMVSSNLVLGPGAKLIFRKDAGLTVMERASITAAGSAEEPIEFVGEEGYAGEWQGLYLQRTHAQLNHVTVRHGGGVVHSFASEPAGITVVTGGSDYDSRLGGKKIGVYEYEGVAIYLDNGVSTAINGLGHDGDLSNTSPAHPPYNHNPHDPVVPDSPKHHR